MKSQPRTLNQNVPSIRVMGFDPSFRAWGFAFAQVLLLGEGEYEVQVERIQLVTTSKAPKKANIRTNSDDLKCARTLHKATVDAVAEWKPALVFSEVPSGAQSATAAKALGIALGVLAACPAPIVQVMPTEVKIATAGTKTATKADMIGWVYERHAKATGWNLNRSTKRPTLDMEHPADAIAAIYAGLQTDEWDRTVALAGAL